MAEKGESLPEEIRQNMKWTPERRKKMEESYERRRRAKKTEAARKALAAAHKAKAKAAKHDPPVRRKKKGKRTNSPRIASLEAQKAVRRVLAPEASLNGHAGGYRVIYEGDDHAPTSKKNGASKNGAPDLHAAMRNAIEAHTLVETIGWPIVRALAARVATERDKG